MLRPWDSLFDLLQPDLILAEYAPSMVLAARGRIPTVMFGTGFTMPPANTPDYPPLQTDVEPIMPQERILAVVQEVQRRRNRPVPAALPEVLACERRFPCTFPEIDPYRAVRREATIPPLGDLPPPLPLPNEIRVFAYLAGDVAGLPKLIGGLAKTGISTGIFVRRISAALRETIKKTQLRLFDEPVPLAQVLPHVTAVLHHGGSGTTEACLTAGRAQILTPRHLEQGLTSRALRELGVGVTLAKDAAEDAVADTVKLVAKDAKSHERAIALAQQIAGRGPRPGIHPIIAACEELAARPRAAAAS